MDKGLKTEVIEANSSNFLRIISWIFALLLLLNGLLNLFRGNDPSLGVAFMLLSLVYIPPLSRLTRNFFGFKIPFALKLVLALILIWISLAVGAIPEGFYPEITG